MKFDRLLSVLALILAILALLISLGIGRPSPLGSDISTYDLSNPKAALSSVQGMVKNNDLRAGIQYLKNLVVMDDKDSDLNFFFDEVTDLNLAKTFVITGSGEESENGKVVSFVTYKVKGVEFRKIFYFKKLDDGTFYLTGAFTPAYYPEEKKTEADKRYSAMIKNFKDTGAVN